MIDTDILKYIAMTQPQLEKNASERASFLNALNSKLVSMVKAGSITKSEAQLVYKNAKSNLANTLNFLDVPAYHHKMGSLEKSSGSSYEKDPLYMFAFS